MTSRIDVNVDLSGLVHLLEGMQRRAGDLRPAWERWGDDVADALRDQFHTEGARFGEAWAALSPRYAAWKTLHFPGKTVLRRTDRLYASLTHRPFAVERVHADSAEFGTDVPYAIFHQRGTRFMPARPIISDDSELIDKARRLVARHITEGLD